MKTQRWLYATLGKRAWLPHDLKNKIWKQLVNCWMTRPASKPQDVYDSQKTWHINNWRRKKNTIVCNILWNNVNVKRNIGWSWTLKLIIEKFEKINVETKCHDAYEKQPPKTFTSTTGFGYVPDGRNRRFQDCRCRDANNEWWGYFNCLQYYKIYGMAMKMFLKMLLNNYNESNV